MHNCRNLCRILPEVEEGNEQDKNEREVHFAGAVKMLQIEAFSSGIGTPAPR